MDTGFGWYVGRAFVSNFRSPRQHPNLSPRAEKLAWLAVNRLMRVQAGRGMTKPTYRLAKSDCIS